MTTNATYVPIVGAERIVSVINNLGGGVAVPLDAEAPAAPEPGNRLIYLILKIERDEGFDIYDANIDIVVKLPAGIIRKVIQKASVADNLVLISPIIRILPYLPAAQEEVDPFAGSIYDEHVSAVGVDIDYVEQTVTIRIKHLAGDGEEQRTLGPLRFGVEIDWNYSADS